MKYIERLKKKFAKYTIKTVFIHIGKCGGSTVRKEFKKNKILFYEKHMTNVKFHRNKKYIIVIRNPISRFVSAFNWRYKLVVEDRVQENTFDGEKMILEKYKTAWISRSN